MTTAAQKARLPRGPRSPSLWQTFRFLLDPYGFTANLVRSYGSIIRISSLNGKGVAITSPELVRQVFAADPDTFATFTVVTEVFGMQSVLATDGAAHKRQRKLLNPRFHGARVKSFLATMQRVTRASLEPLAAKPNDVIVLNDLTQTLTIDIILETIFGADPSLDRHRGRAALTTLVGAVVPAAIASRRFRERWFPPWRRFQAARVAFDAWIDEMLAARRTNDPYDDLLGMLLEARYEDGSPMADSEIRDQLFTLLVAGHETTATTIAWGVYHLARQPDVLTKLRQEIGKLGPTPAPEALVRQPYLEAVASESLRIEPVVTDVTRVCKREFTLGDYVLPEGSVIFVLLCSVLRDPIVYPEPLRFRPERFLERSFSSSEFVPFGGGARRCLGAAFAEAELAIALATIASEWDVELASQAPEPAVRKNITMGPKHGVRVRMKRRALA